MKPEIQRFCWFDTIGFLKTIWKYKRAIEGHKFLIDSIEAIVKDVATGEYVTLQIYDGHTYSHWGSFPLIYDQATLGIFQASTYQRNWTSNLNLWECKEFTMSARNSDSDIAIQFCIIVKFYEVPMSKAEILEYAVKQPRYKYRHGSARTLDRFED